MHPPWTAFIWLLLLFAVTTTISGDLKQKEDDNSTVSRPQRETYERERRLIPYMTYYITQSLTSPNSGVRQNIFVPITPRENIFHLDGATKIPIHNVQNVNPQQIEILPKPIVRLPSSSFLTHTFQGGHYKAKETQGIFSPIYRVESGVVRPQLQTQVQPQQIQSETQPLQVIKINPLSTEQKYSAPQLIKIIPVIKKLPLENRSLNSYVPPQPQIPYPRAKILTSAPGVTYYKESAISNIGNSFQENKIYSGHVTHGNPQFRLLGSTLRPDINKYTIAKIVYGTTTPSPYTEIKFNVNDGRSLKSDSNNDQVSISHLSHQLNPAKSEYAQEPVISTVASFTVTPSQHQIYYDQKENNDQTHESQDLVQKENAEQLPRLRVPQEEKIRFVANVTPIPVTNDLENSYWKAHSETQKKKTHDKESLNNIFSLLKETNKLPQNLTPDNIDIGIKTLALILERLQQQQRHHQHAHRIPTTGTPSPEPPTATVKHIHQDPRKVHSFPEKSGTSTPGRPGIDYPTYSSIPQTNFDCSSQRYKGFFGDPDTNCQVWHYCDLNGGQASFLCPNGTIFSQVALTCDWWFNVKCASTSQLYVLNERLYKYILPFSPSFPEDYSGPVVDTYLAAKFKEMETKSKLKAFKSLTNSTTTENPDITTEASTEVVPTELAEEYQTASTEK